jgi:hypothetical protein
MVATIKRTPSRYSKDSVPIYYIFYNILTCAASMAVDCILSNSHMVGLILQSHFIKHGVPLHTFIIVMEHVQACRKLAFQ